MTFLIGRLLDTAAAAVPDQIAATLGEETLTYRQADARAARLAGVLRKFGIGRGNRVLLWSDLSLRAYDAFFGCARNGAAFVSANPGATDDEIAAILRYIAPALLIVDVAHAGRAAPLAAAAGVRLALNEPDAAGTTAPDALDLEAAMRAFPARYDGPAPSEADTHVIFLTSGSTGVPKGVEISHRAGYLRALTYPLTEPTTGGGGDVCMFPLFHMAGWTQVTGTMAHLRPVHLVARADARTLLGAVERWKARRLYCIPPVWERVLDCTEPFDISSLRETMTGTMRVDPALMQRVHDRFPGTVHRIVYGSTEAGIVLTLGDDALAGHPDHAGLPALGVEVRIEDGELQTRSDFMMSGYFNLSEETAATLRDGWYCTGDLAERDADGYYRIVGRRREVIRTGGETVAPAEVEAAVSRYPGVCAAAVFGVPSSSWGEIVCAALTMDPGHELPSPQAMRAFLDARLVGFKHPRAIVAIDEIPRTAATGQIQRSRVRDIVSARPEFGRVLADSIER